MALIKSAIEWESLCEKLRISPSQMCAILQHKTIIDKLNALAATCGEAVLDSKHKIIASYIASSREKVGKALANRRDFSYSWADIDRESNQ